MHIRLSDQDLNSLKVNDYILIPYKVATNSHPLDNDSRWHWTTAKITGFTKHPRTNKPAVKVQYLDLFNTNKLTIGIIGYHLLSGWNNNIADRGYNWFINHPSTSLQIKALESKINK